MLFIAVNLFCALSFAGYGLTCLSSSYMKLEFERYGLPRFRLLTGTLQLLAAGGLLAGFPVPQIGILAAAGLALQMLLGFGVRLKIRDGFVRSVPALFYFGVCAWLTVQFSARL